MPRCFFALQLIFTQFDMPALDSLIYNGNFHFSNELILSSNNRSFRYGDGCFETMKIINGNIVLQHLHWQRLFSSIKILQFDVPDFFTQDYVYEQIKILVKQNNHQQLARIRLTIFRGDGNLHDDNNQMNFIIQSWSLQQFPHFNEEGFVIDVFEDARKSADLFSSIKTNNYLPYAMATKWCKTKNTNDALITNCYQRIAEATTSNVFIVKDNIIKTPALSEGCIAGVVRSHLLSCIKNAGLKCEETTVTIDDLLDADEVFLTNAGWYIQWVKRLRSKTYTNATARFLFNQFITPLIKINE